MNRSERKALSDTLVSLQPRLRRFAFGLTGSTDDADDLVQSAYARAFERLHQWKPGTRADSWMYRIVHSVHLNQVASTKVRRRHSADANLEAIPNRTTVLPDESVSFSQVRTLIDTLSEEQKSVLMLVTVEGLSYRDTAEVLNLPVGTVMSRLARARITLTEKLTQPVASVPRLVERKRHEG